jgi:hypothetical protein
MKDLKDTSIILELVLIGFQMLIWVSLLAQTLYFELVHAQTISGSAGAADLSKGLLSPERDRQKPRAV